MNHFVAVAVGVVVVVVGGGAADVVVLVVVVPPFHPLFHQGVV